MEDDGNAKKKDREIDVASCVGTGSDGSGLDLGFGFGYGTSHDVDEVSCHREKMIRTDAFPFRATAATGISPIFTAAAASASTPLPPLHPSVSLPFGNGAMYVQNMLGRGDVDGVSHQDAAARALQMQLQASLAASPFKSASHSAAAAALAQPVSAGASCGAAPPGPATALLRPHPLFTPAQWQELQRQALIYKHFVSSAPVPPDLLLETRFIHPNEAVVPGGGFLNLRLSGGTADPEPGRCRRTDGKKWRCSRDAAPDQRYCERHLHRGRPRSRKPVERTRSKASAAAAAVGAMSNNGDSVTTDLGAAAATAFPGFVPSKPASSLQVSSPTPYCGGPLPKPELLKLPFLCMMPEKEEPRYLDWMKDGGIPEMSQHAAPDKSTTVDIAGFRTSVLPILQGYPDCRQLNSSVSDLNGPSYYPFVHPEQPPPPRGFINAWSAEGHTIAGPSSSSRDMPTNQFAASSEQLSPSNLTLSMSGGGGGDYVPEHIQMGLAVNELSSNATKSQAMFGPFGGPLAEVLQSGSSSVASPRTGSALVGAPVATSYTGLMNLMSRTCCSGGSEGVVSPRGESPPRVLSSPTGVLQRALVSLSDSSSNSSPRFGAGCGGARPEVVGIQWMNQNKKWW